MKPSNLPQILVWWLRSLEGGVTAAGKQIFRDQKHRRGIFCAPRLRHRKRHLPPIFVHAVALVTDPFAFIREDDQLTVGNNTVASFVIDDDGEIVAALAMDNITAKKWAAVVAAENTHDRRRQVDLAGYPSDAARRQMGRAQKQCRNPVLFDRKQTRAA